MKYVFRCRDCGNDGSSTRSRGFRIVCEAFWTGWIDGSGQLSECAEVSPKRFYWDTLKCGDCGSANVERKAAPAAMPKHDKQGPLGGEV